jgi:hypothetical protein
VGERREERGRRVISFYLTLGHSVVEKMRLANDDTMVPDFKS